MAGAIGLASGDPPPYACPGRISGACEECSQSSAERSKNSRSTAVWRTAASSGSGATASTVGTELAAPDRAALRRRSRRGRSINLRILRSPVADKRLDARRLRERATLRSMTVGGLARTKAELQWPPYL